VHGEGRHLGGGAVAEDRPQELADARGVREDPGEVVGGLRPDRDDADLDQLVHRLGEQAGGDEDQADPGPAEERAKVDAAAAGIEDPADSD